MGGEQVQTEAVVGGWVVVVVVNATFRRVGNLDHPPGPGTQSCNALDKNACGKGPVWKHLPVVVVLAGGAGWWWR